MNNDNPDFESQYKDRGPFGEVLGKAYQRTKEFYREYVIDDYDHEFVSKVLQSAAMCLVQSSPYRAFLSSYQIDSAAAEDVAVVPSAITNKGAVRITPSVPMRNILKDVSTQFSPARHSELFGDHGWLSSWSDYSSKRFELWVYNQDGFYYLTRPRSEGTDT
jgi:hypothetical protein